MSSSYMISAHSVVSYHHKIYVKNITCIMPTTDLRINVFIFSMQNPLEFTPTTSSWHDIAMCTENGGKTNY